MWDIQILINFPSIAHNVEVDCSFGIDFMYVWCLCIVHEFWVMTCSGQAWQLYCRVKGGLWKGANGLVLVYSSLHEVLFAWLMFELLSSWGTCATPADESPITLRLQGSSPWWLRTEMWDIQILINFPSIAHNIEVDCSFGIDFYVCLMSVHCARILSHDMQWAGMAALLQSERWTLERS